jgi:hypothetical protein
LLEKRQLPVRNYIEGENPRVDMEVGMVSFVALFRGESVEEAEIIALSSAPNVVEGFFRELESDGLKQKEGYPPLRVLHADDE